MTASAVPLGEHARRRERVQRFAQRRLERGAALAERRLRRHRHRIGAAYQSVSRHREPAP
jgi:hypothetical protein